MPRTDTNRLIVAGTTVFGLVLCAIVGYSLWREYRITLAQAESRTVNRARVIEQYTRETMRRIEQGLAHATEEAARAGSPARLDITEMRNSLQALGSSDELFQRLIVVDRDGGTVLATAPRAGAPADWAQHEDFIAHRARQGSRIIFGAPVGGGATGKRFVPVSIRITEKDGGFAGLVVVEIDPAYLTGVLQSTSNEPGSFATVFLRSGWIIARNPPDEAIMANTWLDTPMFREHLPAAPSGSVRQVVVATGMESLYSYRALIDYPVVVAAGVSLTAALAPWRERMARDLALLGIALGILAGATSLLLRNLRRRDRAEARILRLNMLYAAQSKINAAVMRAADFPSLCKEVCEIAVEVGGMSCALVRLLDTERQLLLPVAFHGPDTGLIGRHELPATGSAGISASAFGKREATVVNDIATSPITQHALRDLSIGAVRSAAAFPLTDGEEKAFGTFAVFGPGTGFFDAEMTTLLAETCTSLAFAHGKLSGDLALKASERDLMLAQRGGRIGSFIIDIASSTWTASEVGSDILGLDGRLPRPLADFAAILSAKGKAEALVAMRANIASGERTDHTYRIDSGAGGGERWVRVIASTETGPDGAARRRIGTVQDVTDQMAAEERVHQLGRLKAALSKTNAAIARATGFDALCGEVCRVAVEEGGLVAATVALHNPGTHSLEVIAGHGRRDGRLSRNSAGVDDPVGAAPAAFRGNRRVIITDLVAGEHVDNVAAEAAAQGITAIGAFPLSTSGSCFGTFAVFAPDARVLDGETAEVLEEIADALAFAHAKLLAQTLLGERERDLELAQRAGRVGIIITDLGHATWMSNTVGGDILGLDGPPRFRPLDEFVALLAPETRDEAARAMRRNLDSGATVQQDYEIVRPPDGRRRRIRLDTGVDTAANPASNRRIGTLRDITEQSAAEHSIRRLSRLYAALSNTNAAVLRARDFAHLGDIACRIAVEDGGLNGATIRLHDAATATLRQIASFGSVRGMIARPVIAVDSPVGVAAAAFRGGQPVIVRDMQSDPITVHAGEDGRAAGVHATACFPLGEGGATIGTFTIFAGSGDALDGATLGLLAEIAAALGFAHAKFRSEAARHDADARIAAVVGSAMDAIITCEEDLRIAVFNDAAAHMFRCPAAQAIGAPIDHFLPERFRGAHAGFMRGFGTGGVTSRAMGRPGQITALRADGSEFPAEASISHTRVNGQVVYTVIMRDVTARLASVRRIERLTNLYAALSKTNEAIVRGDNWRQLCDAVCRLIVDHGGVQAAVIRAPDQTGRMLEPVAGYGPRSDQVGSGSIDIDDPEHPTAAVFREGLSRVVDDILAVAPIAGHDAATTLGVRSVVVVPLRAGAACTGTLTVFAHEVAHFDVELTRLVEELAGDLAFAHRKFEADRALIESELRYRSLVESSLNGVVILNGENIEYANPGFVRMLGYPSTEDAVGRSILSLATPEFHPQLRGNISRLSTRPKQNLPAARMRMRRADGAVIDVQAAASSIELEGRTLIQSEIRDITRERNALAEIRALNENLEARIEERTRELRDANARLEAANRDLESFSYSVAHDLRAPLRTMNGFAQLLEMDVAAGSYDEIPRHASRISHNATRMNSLIDGLLAVARATHGALGDDRIDFAAMVADTVREANPGPRVRFDIGPLPVVRGDNPTLLQVWRNLISNAIKYSAKRDDPRIDIACELRDGEIVFHVRDNGAGFDPAYAQRLFGVFQRLHTAQEFEGNGVGLAVVRRIVERHGGRAWAEGRPDAGATFRFSLPASRIVTPAS